MPLESTSSQNSVLLHILCLRVFRITDVLHECESSSFVFFFVLLTLTRPYDMQVGPVTFLEMAAIYQECLLVFLQHVYTASSHTVYGGTLMLEVFLIADYCRVYNRHVRKLWSILFVSVPFGVMCADLENASSCTSTKYVFSIWISVNP